MMKIKFISLFFTLHGIVAAQHHDSAIKIGSEVPDITFTTINYPSSQISLSSFRGKLVILDLWATWCNSCIAAFPKLDSIQKKLKGQVQIILVNNINGSGDTREKIDQFLKQQKVRNRKIPELPIVVEDTLTRRYFPHTYVPHYIWIAPDGSLLAVTSPEFVSIQSIQGILRDKKIRELLSKNQK